MADAYETTTDPAQTLVTRISGLVRAGVSYLLFAIGIAALLSFFAPHVGVPAAAWHTAVVPSIAAPTEGDAVVDVAPLILGIVSAGVGVWIR